MPLIRSGIGRGLYDGSTVKRSRNQGSQFIVSARQIAVTFLDCAVIAVFAAAFPLSAASRTSVNSPLFEGPPTLSSSDPARSDGPVRPNRRRRTISAIYTIADSGGVPLDSTGISTAGTVTVSFIARGLRKAGAVHVVHHKDGYRSRKRDNHAAGADSGGKTQVLADGQYQYTFKTKAPSGFDATATTTIGHTFPQPDHFQSRD